MVFLLDWCAEDDLIKNHPKQSFGGVTLAQGNPKVFL
jgi:hypothetical protein